MSAQVLKDLYSQVERVLCSVRNIKIFLSFDYTQIVKYENNVTL